MEAAGAAAVAVGSRPFLGARPGRPARRQRLGHPPAEKGPEPAGPGPRGGRPQGAGPVTTPPLFCA